MVFEAFNLPNSRNLQKNVCCSFWVHADMIEELISRGQQVDAVHFTHEVGLVERFPPVSLLKAFLKDAKKAATSIMEDPNNSGRAQVLNTPFFIYKI